MPWKWDAPPGEKTEYKKRMKERASNLFCPDEVCEKYGEEGLGNIRFVWKYGKEETQNLFRCTVCKTKFSERKGTPLFNLRLPEEKTFEILQCFVEGNGIRGTGRIKKVGKGTVVNMVKRFGPHMEAIHDFFVQDYHLDECQLDELWSFIEKNKRI